MTIQLKEYFAGSLFIEFKSVSFSANKKRAYWKFPAFLNSFSDKYVMDFQKEQVYGRNDPIVGFKSTGRVINMSFIVASENSSMGRNNWLDMERMGQATYPKYATLKAGEQVISSPPIFGMRFKNLVRENENGLDGYLYGIFDSFNIVPNVAEGFYITGNTFWNKDAYGGNKGGAWEKQFFYNSEETFIIPKSYTVDLTFTVIHTMFRGNTSSVVAKMNRGGPSVDPSNRDITSQGYTDGMEAKRRNKINRALHNKKPPRGYR